MARGNRPQSPFADKGHLESDAEYHHRVQKRMEQDAWQGCDTVGADFPDRAIAHDMTSPEDREPPHVYNWGERKKGY